jgi:hypothetical protein
MSAVEPVSPGWEPMSDRLTSEVTRSFRQRLSFRPSTRPRDWPSIAEPTPSVTLDLSPTWTGSGDMAFDPDELILGLLVAAFPASERLVAINYNHCAWWFWPHRFSAVGRESPYSPGEAREIMVAPDVFVAADSWEMHPFPNGDYSIVVSEDMTSGTFGHPWEQTLCVFGTGPVEAAPTLTPYWPVKRHRS